MRVTLRDVLVTALENLNQNGFKKFRGKLHDIDVQPSYKKIPRGLLEDKDHSDVADLIRLFYRDTYGIEVTLAVLEAINEKLVAEELTQDLKKVERFVRLNAVEEGKRAAPTVRPVRRSLCVSGELKCSLTLENFYPGYLHITWMGGEKESPDLLSSQDVYSEDNDLFTVCSEVTIPQDLLKHPRSTVFLTWEHEYTSSGGGEELLMTDPEFPWQPVVEDIQLPRLYHHLLATLECYISGYFPDAVTVTWLRRTEKHLELCEDSDMVSVTKISSDKASDHTYSCKARLTITPTLRDHQGAEYVCRVEHPSLEKAIVKSSGKLCLLAKPQMDAIKMDLVDKMMIQFLLSLKMFYPKDVTFKWHWGEKEPRKGVRRVTKHTETITEQDDSTFCVTSQCAILACDFSDPEYKFYVTWEHEAMDVPETRIFSVKDLPWHPKLANIVVLKLEDNQKSKIRCSITGYFPNVLSVVWLKKVRGEVSAVPVSDNVFSEIAPHKDTKHTFGCTAILHFTPTIPEDQGSEFICRVEHPSLEQPVEISTRPLEILPSESS